jgi:hypothetical protein
MLNARVELICLDGSPLPADPVHYFFTAAHHSDFPLRPTYFGASNTVFANTGDVDEEVSYAGQGQVFFGDDGLDFGQPTVWYVSAQMFVVLPTPANGGIEVVTVLPVAPGFSSNIVEVQSGKGRLNKLMSYRIDCEFPNRFNGNGKLLASRPLVRSDFLPSIEVKVQQKEQDQVVDFFLTKAFSKLSDSENIPELSQYFLLSGDLEDQFQNLKKSNEYKSLGDYLGAYIASTNESHRQFFPQFLPNNAHTSVTMQLLGQSRKLMLGKFDINQPKVAGAPDEANGPEPTRKDEFKFVVELKGLPFGAVSQNLDAYAVGDREGKCEVAEFDGDAFPSIEAILVCAEIPADIHLFSRSNDGNITPESLRLRAVTDEDVGSRSIAVLSADVTVTGFELRPDEAFEASLRDHYSEIALDALFAERLLGENCSEEQSYTITLDDVLSGFARIDACEAKLDELTVQVPSDFHEIYGARIVSTCVKGRTVTEFDDGGRANCAFTEARPDILSVEAGAFFEPLLIKVEQDASKVQLTKSDVLLNLEIDRTALLQFELLADRYDGPRPAPRVTSVAFLLGEAACGDILDVVKVPSLSLSAANCLAYPTHMVLEMELIGLDVGIRNAFRPVTLPPISLRGEDPDAITIPEFERPIVIDVAAQEEAEQLLGGADRHVSNDFPGWLVGLFADPACTTNIATLVPGGAMFGLDGQMLEDLTWPTYGQVRWFESRSRSFNRSDCTPISIGDVREQGNADGFFSFEVTPLPGGRSVMILAVSGDVNESGRRSALQAALEKMRANYEALSQVTDEPLNDLELWGVTSEGSTKERLRLSQVAAQRGAIQSLFRNEIERGGAPVVPDLGLIEQTVRLSEANAGAILVFDGAGYNQDIERIFARVSSEATETSPDKFWLFLVDGCSRWTEFARPEIQNNCTNMLELNAAELEAGFDEVLSSILRGEN